MEKEHPTRRELMLDVIGLYVFGVLQQYGLSDEDALDIVANLTKLKKQTLIELKNKKVDNLSEQMSGATDEILGAMGFPPKL